MNECVFLYRTYHIVSQGGLQFYLSEIGRQLVKYAKPITLEKVNFLNTKIQPQNIASLVVKQPFGPRQKECGGIGERVASQSEFFSYSESKFFLAFKSEREAQAHMDSGKQVGELESVPLYDTIRLRWAERVTSISRESASRRTWGGLNLK